MRENPFLFSSDPYGRNPFSLLEVPPNANQATIEQFAAAARARRSQGGTVEPVDAEANYVAAARSLQDPVVRLAFDLMTNGAGIAHD